MRLKIGLSVILLVLVPSLSGADERADVLKMAWELFYEGKFEEAAELGEKVYEKGDEYSSALLGLSYMKLGECEKALDRIFYVEGWLDLNMDSVEELSKKEDINSRKAASQARFIHEKVKFVSGYCNNEMENWIGSVSAIEAYVQYQKEDPSIYPILGESHMRLAEGSYKNAISAFEKYLSMKDAKPEVKEGVKFALAQVFSRIGDIDSGVKWSISLLSESSSSAAWLSRMRNNPDFSNILKDKRMKKYLK